MKRRRNKQIENEQTVALEQVLEPYEQQWADENDYSAEEYTEAFEEEYPADYEEFYGEDYSAEHAEADSEDRFRIAMGLFDLISIVIGIAVILVLVSLLITLLNWLRNDVLHSAMFLQSGLK